MYSVVLMIIVLSSPSVRSAALPAVTTPPQLPWHNNEPIPLEPLPGVHRCGGSKLTGERCCTPENPCGEGDGDCNVDMQRPGMEFAGPHAGCRGELVCGTNNCQKFGRFFDEEDDCCERPNSENIETSPPPPPPPPQCQFGLAPTLDPSTQTWQCLPCPRGLFSTLDPSQGLVICAPPPQCKFGLAPNLDPASLTWQCVPCPQGLVTSLDPSQGLVVCAPLQCDPGLEPVFDQGQQRMVCMPPSPPPTPAPTSSTTEEPVLIGDCPQDPNTGRYLCPPQQQQPQHPPIYQPPRHPAPYRPPFQPRPYSPPYDQGMDPMMMYMMMTMQKKDYDNKMMMMLPLMMMGGNSGDNMMPIVMMMMMQNKKDD